MAAVCLGHRRLSIIDLDPRSEQPMTSRDGRFVIVFNGEIYNYLELRRELVSQGCTFRTEGDTEVMLELLARDGVGAVERLRGMFAFALWNNEDGTLYLARDPYGIKPLYFAESDAGVLFASQVKALTASGAISRTVDPAGLAGFLLWGSVPEPRTHLRGYKGRTGRKHRHNSRLSRARDCLLCRYFARLEPTGQQRAALAGRDGPDCPSRTRCAVISSRMCR